MVNRITFRSSVGILWTAWPVMELSICKIKTVYVFKCGTSVYGVLVIMWNRKYQK